MLAVGSIGDYAIADEAGGFGLSGRVLPYWVTINGPIVGNVLMETINIEHTAEGTARAALTVINPPDELEAGMVLCVVEEDRDLFAGIIRTVKRDSDQSETVIYYHVEADGWDVLLTRHLVTWSYTNISTKSAILALLVDGKLQPEGVQPGFLDDGVTLFLVDAKYVRASDYLRDVGSAGGGVAYIDDHKFLQYRPTNPLRSPIVINESNSLSVSRLSDIDNYRNRQFVKVTGLDGTTTVVEQRDDIIEQAARVALEGFSGIYEHYDEVTHPTSSVPGELSSYGQATAFLLLRTFSRTVRRITIGMRLQAPNIGELVTVSLTAFGIAGDFLVMNHRQQDRIDGWQYTLELWESSFQQLALQSLLNIVKANRAAVSISSAVFPNVQLFSTAGAFTWTVPGGVTSAQFTVYGAGGGGGGGRWGFSSISGYYWYGNGGKGGNGGKAVSILAVTAGQVYDLVIGAAGVHGANGAHGSGSFGLGQTPGTDGTDGADSTVKLVGVLKVQGDLGHKGLGQAPGGAGADGAGTADAVVPGGGSLGGAGGIQSAEPTSGVDGLVEVRW